MARPLRPVNLGLCDGAVEQHDKSASRRFRVLHARRCRPLAETLREPLAVTVRDGPRRVTEIASLIDEGIIRPVVDRVFPFASTKDAMAYVEAGRAKGKVVVSLT